MMPQTRRAAAKIGWWVAGHERDTQAAQRSCAAVTGGGGSGGGGGWGRKRARRRRRWTAIQDATPRLSGASEGEPAERAR
jgi:hypothetical protein